MENNFLDKFFKKKLTSLDGGEPLDSWAMLNEKLDANLIPESEEDTSFDQKVKDSISDISAKDMPAWEAFLPSLNLEENLVEIDSDITLDETIKSNLENLSPSYEAATWDVLANRLDILDRGPVVNDAELDQVAYDKLLNYTVPQRAGDWETFSKELNKEFVLPYKLLFKYKLAEVTILLSLILIFFQAKPLIENHIHHQKTNKTINTPVITKLLSNSESDVAKNKALIESPAIAHEPSMAIKKHLDNKVISTKTVSNKKAAQLTSSTPFEKKSASEIKYIEANAKKNFSPLTSDNELYTASLIVTAVVEGKSTQIQPAQNKPQLIVEDDESALASFGPRLKTSKLPIGSLVSISFEGNKEIPLCISCSNLNSILNWRLGAHVDAEYTYIMTPYDKNFDLKSYNHAALGYGFGLSTSLMLGNWELESGFGYSTRQYTPKATPEILGNLSLGYLTIELDEIQMNLLSIPLNLRYHFKDQSSKTHIYLHGGATMQVATQASYFIKSDFLGNNKRPSLTDSNKLKNESNTSSDKIYSLGWLDGGSFIENRYYTINLGIGFERKISARYSIFGQTTYAHYLDRNGIGPNNDRFNSLGISTGVRALFK